MNTKKIEADR